MCNICFVSVFYGLWVHNSGGKLSYIQCILPSAIAWLLFMLVAFSNCTERILFDACITKLWRNTTAEHCDCISDFKSVAYIYIANYMLI